MYKVFIYLTFAFLVYAVSVGGDRNSGESSSEQSGEDNTTNDGICESSDGQCCETKCPYGWVGFKGQCYSFRYRKRTWYDAETDCLADNSHLVTVDNQEQSNWLKLMMTARSGICHVPNAVFYEEKCYWMSPQYLSYSSGQNYCESFGGHVVDIGDAQTFLYLTSRFRTESYRGFWTGLWFDGSGYQNSQGNAQTPYFTWVAPEPNQGIQRCVRVYRNEWSDVGCHLAHNTLCSHDFDGGNQSFWIGGSDLLVEGTFQWISKGKVFDFQEFRDTQPNGGDQENCVYYNSPDGNGEYKWEDVPCCMENFSICQKDPDCE